MFSMNGQISERDWEALESEYLRCAEEAQDCATLVGDIAQDWARGKSSIAVFRAHSLASARRAEMALKLLEAGESFYLEQGSDDFFNTKVACDSARLLAFELHQILTARNDDDLL